MVQRPINEEADPLVVIGLVPRFYLGAVFAIAALTKIVAPHGYVAAVRAFLISPATSAAPAWYATFINTNVIPNISTWAAAVVLGEVCIALSLIFGLFTRLGAAVAIFALANYTFATGMAFWTPGNVDAADIILAFVVLMSGPGRIFGIDRFLVPR
jgi:uncharacterized membrane protein YphA (DoxX/SURF4 family)